MIKVLKGMLARENGLLYLYEQFYQAPAFIKQIYTTLEGDELYQGETQPRKSIFASILNALT